MSRSAPASPQAADALGVLHAQGIEVDASPRRRAEYSTDASNYRVVPDLVAFPRSADEVLAIGDAARSTGLPVTPRGGGTSVAGNAVGAGVVIDFSRHLNRVLEVDPDARTAVVEPGAVLGDLQRAAGAHGLRFGPDPSTWARCTVGGMIGNNACGPRALAFGRTADNVIALDAVDGTGRRIAAGQGAGQVPGLDDLIAANLDILRTELGGFGRQISGYGLEHLLPENGRDLAKALAGSEGTLVTLLSATVRLVDVVREPLIVVLGYPDMLAAADAVPALLGFGATAIEGLDARLVEAVIRERGSAAAPPLPAGGGWLLVELADGPDGGGRERAGDLVRASGALSSAVLTGSPARAVWRLREDGAGIAGRTPSGRQAWPGVEDAAVPPERLGGYLREFDGLLARYGFEGLPYGHFGDGCVHVRLDIPLERDGSVLRAFMSDAAELIARHGGSLSGEHGDGRARSELLPAMYSPRMLALFGQVKALFDPRDVLNPGVIVSPAPIDADLRRPAAPRVTAGDGLAFAADGGDITRAVHRCVGVGKCRAASADSGGYMCPSFQATRDEKDSTRGRARVLQEMINGRLVTGSWEADEVAESLDLCLSCKACASDCPAGVDMAALKSETLHRKHRGRIRPIAHYTLGWLPRWARLAAPIAPVANALLALRPLEKLVLVAGGMDARRSIPRFQRPARRRLRSRRGAPSAAARGRVALWIDSFTDGFDSDVAVAAFALLEQAGVDVVVPEGRACCGLTWITTGQLDGARSRLRSALDVLAPIAEQGIPILGLEPSCVAALRSDLEELLPDDPRAALVPEHVMTLAELLTSTRHPEISMRWRRPDLHGVDIVLQAHCHQHAVMGEATDIALLRELGADVRPVGGCCGLAGNFGMERGHYDVSVAVAENALLPALREAPEGSVLLADGISCRTQAEQLAHVRGMHLAQLLVSARPGTRGGPVAGNTL